MSNHEHATYFCKKCLHGYKTHKLLKADAEDCCHAQRTKSPKDSRCRFTNVQEQLPVPFVVYAGEDAAVMFVRKLEATRLFDETKCCLLLQSHNHLPLPPPVIYAQNRLEMIKYETFVTLEETIVVVLTTHVTCSIEYPEPVGS